MTQFAIPGHRATWRDAHGVVHVREVGDCCLDYDWPWITSALDQWRAWLDLRPAGTPQEPTESLIFMGVDMAAD